MPLNPLSKSPAILQSPADLLAYRRVVHWLNDERGAVSANVTLPSGRHVTIHRNGDAFAAPTQGETA